MLLGDDTREALEQAVERAEDFIFVVDRTLSVQILSPAGAGPSPIRSGASVMAPGGPARIEDSSSQLRRSVLQIFETGSSVSYEERLLLQDREAWFDTRLSPIADPGGPPHSVLGISRDITERKEREDRIACSRREWLRAVDGMPYLLAVIGADHRIERVNQTMALRLGTTVRDAIGLRCCERLHGAMAPPVYCPLLGGGGARDDTTEVAEPHLGGETIACMTPIRDGADAVVGCLYMARDGTLADRSFDARRSSEEYMRLLLRSTDHAVYVQDPGGKYVSFTAMPGERIPWEVIGRTPFEFFEPAVASRLVDRVRRVAVRGKCLTEQLEISWCGEALQFFDKISPVTDALGRVKAVATISMKVGEIRREAGAGPVPGAAPAASVGPAGLTLREREVLQLIARGLTSGQIAATLAISRKTVETHRARIMQKLDIHKTSALVNYAAKFGLL